MKRSEQQRSEQGDGNGILHYLLLRRVGTRRVTPAGYFSMHRTKKVANKQERREMKLNQIEQQPDRTRWDGKKRDK